MLSDFVSACAISTDRPTRHRPDQALLVGATTCAQSGLHAQATCSFGPTPTQPPSTDIAHHRSTAGDIRLENSLAAIAPIPSAISTNTAACRSPSATASAAPRELLGHPEALPISCTPGKLHCASTTPEPLPLPPQALYEPRLYRSAPTGDGALKSSAHRRQRAGHLMTSSCATSPTRMPESQSGAYALLESSFAASPNLRSHKPLPRPRDDHTIEPAAAPLREDTAAVDDETDSQSSSQLPTPIESPTARNAAESGLPPTPPSNSQDGLPTSEFGPPPHVDGVVASLTSRKSTISTPVNQRSPPTPDPSPPRTTGSMITPERPVLFAYPSSRAESFTTAREDPASSEAESRSTTPLAARLSVVEEDRGLGLAFEHDGDESTPRNTMMEVPSETASFEEEPKRSERDEDSKGILDIDDRPFREWDTNLMRNVTVRKKRSPKKSPQKNLASTEPVPPATNSTPRRSSSLRERVEASKDSPQSSSMEKFARSIGWPTDTEKTPCEQTSPSEKKRNSTSSTSTVVEAMVIVTPVQPLQRRRTLRHSGKNLAYRRDTDNSTEPSLATHSNRTSLNLDDVPLHRLVHKRLSINDRARRISSDSATLGDRTASPLSLRKRALDSAAATLAHQQSVRTVLQPAAEIMSRSNSVTRNTPIQSLHKRIASAPEATARMHTPSPAPHSIFDLSPPESPSPKRERKPLSKLAHVETASPTSLIAEHPTPLKSTPVSPSVRRFRVPKSPLDVNKSLPDIPSELPIQSTSELSPQEEAQLNESEEHENHPPPALLERVRHLLAEREITTPVNPELQHLYEPSRPRASTLDSVPTIRRGSASTRRRSEERRRSSHSQDHASGSRDMLLRPSPDHLTPDEIPRNSHEWHSFHADEHGRVSFDRSTTRTEEHAMARHLFSQSTPFSQFSDTPIEISEATTVEIYPHNNHSLLVVQQVARSSTQPLETRQIANGAHFRAPDSQELDAPPTPPFLDAQETLNDELPNPTLTIEPSTPPMQLSLPAPGAVDSPLKNPRKPPEPPVIKFIPPTPAEELERQLVPGPPKRSDSHPQRRLSFKQRARRYSDNFISPFLARASSIRGRHISDPPADHGQVKIPTVNDEEDGSLHPFWRPRGFWDGFEDSDSEDDDILPRGGDTSDVVDNETTPQSPTKLGVLGRRLTNGFKGSGGFLIGNSLGVERAGTNTRRPRIDLPSRRASARFARRQTPKILIQPPTIPLGTRPSRIEKRSSRASLRSSTSLERRRKNSAGETWRNGKRIPGLKGVQVQYIGLSGVKERLKERRAERRRDALRKSIGGRWYVEPGTPGAASA